MHEVEKKRKLRSPAAPFTTSTLQQEAVRKLGFSTDRAMKVAQSLYEGVTRSARSSPASSPTCARTRSRLSKEAITEMRGYITKNYGADYLPKAPVHVSQQLEERAGGARGHPPDLDRAHARVGRAAT